MDQQLDATHVAIPCCEDQCSPSILKHGDIVGEKRERGEEGGRRRLRGGRGGVWVVMMNGSWINGYDSTDGYFSEGWPILENSKFVYTHNTHEGGVIQREGGRVRVRDEG